MRSLAAVLLVVATACQEAPSKLDGVRSATPEAQPGAATPALPALPSNASLEDRVARLEGQLKKYAEPLEFLNKVYAQQQQQQKQQEREEPAPDAVFAVDIANDVKAGQVEGPSGATITIVEAWDFA